MVDKVCRDSLAMTRAAVLYRLMAISFAVVLEIQMELAEICARPKVTVVLI
jgi:hypothetical protein